VRRFIAICAILIAAAWFAARPEAADTATSGKISPRKMHAAVSGKTLIPGGVFEMGSKDREPDERPLHTVTVDSFFMDTREATNAEYEKCVEAGACAAAHYDDNHCNVMTDHGWWDGIAPSVFKDPGKPVVCINWYEAKRYCEWKGGSLPAEAQWEYAARAGVKTKYQWGDDADKGCGCANGADIDGAKVFETVWDNRYPQKMNCRDGNAYTARGASYKPNGFGLYDMTGNVWEWCGDWYAPRYGSSGGAFNPAGPDTGVYKILRGGAAESNPDHLTLTYRDRSLPFYRMLYDGVRCVYKK
jgi:formylglycine-generating enzyme